MSGNTLPGMDEQEWQYREGKAMTEHGSAIGDRGLVLEGLGKSVAALRDSFEKSVSERRQRVIDEVGADVFDPEKFEDIFIDLSGENEELTD